MKKQGLLCRLLSKCEFVPMWTLYSRMCKKPSGNAENYPAELSPRGYADPATFKALPVARLTTHWGTPVPTWRHDPLSGFRQPSCQRFKMTQDAVNLSSVHRPTLGPFQGKCHIYWYMSIFLRRLMWVKPSYYSYKVTIFIKKKNKTSVSDEMCAFLTHFPHKSRSFNHSIVYSAVIFQEYVWCYSWTDCTVTWICDRKNLILQSMSNCPVGKGIVFGGLQRELSGTAL